MIGDFLKGVTEAFEVFESQGAAFSGYSIEAALAVRGTEEVRATQPGASVAMEGVNPEPFGSFVVLVKVGAVATVSLGEAQGGPVSGLIDGAVMGLRIAETFGQQGGKSVMFLPPRGEGFQGQAEAA